jgi:Predicted NTP pyrophosphohydrolase
VVHAWALEGDFDPASLTSNTYSVEFPKGSGQFRDYPEVDRAEWFTFHRGAEAAHNCPNPAIGRAGGGAAISRRRWIMTMPFLMA